MKHLKKFNESLGSFDNKLMTANQANEFRNNGARECLEFDNNEKNLLTNFFAQYRGKLYENPDQYWNPDQNAYVKYPRLGTGVSGRYVSIYKLEDEWYVVYIYRNSGIYKWWKCDGFDGLIHVLEEDMAKLKKVPSEEFLSLLNAKKNLKERKARIIKRIRDFSEEEWDRLSGIIDNWDTIPQ
jgi:hypothetical protein